MRTLSHEKHFAKSPVTFTPLIDRFTRLGAMGYRAGMSTQPLSKPWSSRFRLTFAIFAVALLSVPLIAMQFTSEVNWKVGDFAVFAAMLVALGFGLEAAVRLSKSHIMRASGIAVAIVLFVGVWAALAVG